MSEDQSGIKITLKKCQKSTLIAGIVALFLFLSKMLIGFISNSSALLSDSLNNFSDLLIMIASWIGFKISQREKTSKFPFGFYKAESLITLTLSVFMVYGTIMLFLRGINNIFELPNIQNLSLALIISLISIGTSLGISRYLRYMGNKYHSDLLIVNSKERMMDVLASSIVFMAILASSYQIPYFEGIITIIISLLICRVGLISIKDALFSLMDVSPSEEFDKNIKEIIKNIDGVDDFKDLKLRKSGSFIFGEVKINIKKTINVINAHEISEEIEDQICKEIPQIESFIVYIEPSEKKSLKLVIPIKNKASLNSEVIEHFGRAKYFFLGRIENNELKEFEILENPFINKKIRAGLAVVKFLKKKEVDILVTKQIGEISFHSLRDYLIDIYFINRTTSKTVKQVLNDFFQGNITRLLKPTREKD